MAKPRLRALAGGLYHAMSPGAQPSAATLQNCLDTRYLMSFRTKFSLIILSSMLAIYTVVGGWISTRAQQPANDPNAQLRIFESVLQHIQNDYVDEPNMEKVRAGALRGLAYGLDPYSTYLTADQVKQYGDERKK